MRQETIDIAIVIVSWNVWDLLRACLHAIEDQTESTPNPQVRRFGPHGEATLRVVVVDNASQDATPSLLSHRFPWVQGLFLDENLGFTGGNNQGLRALGLLDGPVDEEAGLPRFVYFLNPDTEPLPGSLWALYRGIAGDPTIGAIGPQLRYGDGSLQSSRRRFPTRLTGFFESTWLERAWPDNPWARRYHVAEWSPQTRQDVDWLVGAALLVRGEALAAVGGFDEGFFMYSEELDLCWRIKAAGWRVVYDPAAVVIHYEGRSSEQVAARRHILFNRSKVRFYRKRFGPLWAELLRRYLLFEYRWQMALERLKWLLGHKRSLRQERIAAYRAVLEDGLEVED
ncbi:MAG: glycosyltransferase family 2 protein [Caldilineae bacterium]|nr:MAG: glycosyltransferase family 2 protein [Caldilineae bacterium]